MAENNTQCPFHYDHENRIHVLEENIRGMNQNFNDINLKMVAFIERTTIANENISKAIDKLSSVPEDVKELKKDVTDLKDQMKEINNDDSISIRKLLKKYWWIGVFIGGAVLIGIRCYINNGKLF